MICPMGRFTPIIIIAFLIFVAAPQVSFCQILTVPTEPSLKPSIRAQVAATSVYDDNIFSQPTPTSDLTWRVSPAVTARGRLMGLNISSFCTFDAEQFQNHAELSTSLARLTSSLDATAKPTPRVTLVLNAGYAKTSTPADLNVTTGLATDRAPAREWRGGSEVRRTLTPIATVGARYQFRGQFSLRGVGIETHEAGVWLARELGPRGEIRVRFVGELFAFDPGRTIASETTTIGVTHRMTDTMAVSLDGGARYTLGSIRPEIVAAIAQRRRKRELTLAYTMSHGTAIGVPTLVEVQRAQAELAYHPSIRMRAAVQAAVFVNTLGAGSAHVYRLSASIARSIAGPVSFRIEYATDLQRGEADALQSQDQRIERNMVSIGLVVFPLAAR
jgi:hypothetical protein